MKTWKIEPTMKKCLVECECYHKDDKTIIRETVWRWGEFLIATEDHEKPVLEEGVDLYDCEYEVEMQYTHDGCSVDYEFDGIPEDEQDALIEWIDENSFYDLEGEGWHQGDTNMYLQCEPQIEEWTGYENQ
jgi:hypothetical protein